MFSIKILFPLDKNYGSVPDYNEWPLIFIVAGVAIGAGWQAVVAYVNIACYYILGVPLGLILGFKLDWGVKVKYVKYFGTSLNSSNPCNFSRLFQKETELGFT